MSKSKANIARHKKLCTICKHPAREAIEREFTSWTSPTRIAGTHEVSTDAIYRHANAVDLLSKRRQNVRAALERIIEKSDSVDVNASAVVSAIQTLARINAKGEWIEPEQVLDVNLLFLNMSKEQLEKYARTGILPAGFPAIATRGQGGEDAS